MGYILWTPSNSSSLNYPIFPFCIFKVSGSLPPGTGLPNTVSKTIPLCSLGKLLAIPFTSLSLNYCSVDVSAKRERALLTIPTFVVGTI